MLVIVDIDVIEDMLLTDEEVEAAAPLLLVELGMANPQRSASSIASLSKSPLLERMQLPQLGRRLEASAEVQTQFKYAASPSVVSSHLFVVLTRGWHTEAQAAGKSSESISSWALTATATMAARRSRLIFMLKAKALETGWQTCVEE